MEIRIVDTAETAKIKLDLMNKIMLKVFLYICVLLLVLGTVCLTIGLTSDYSHISSANGYYNYYNYHLGVGIGTGMLITSAYLGLYHFRLKNRMSKFNHSITTYTINETEIKIFSNESESTVNWNSVQEIKFLKSAFLIATNNYSCPTLLILRSQVTKDQLDWLINRLTKK